MGLNLVYRKNSSGVNISYDYTNILTGEGVIEFYAGTAGSDIFQSFTFNSDPIYSSAAIPAPKGNAANIITKSFNVTIAKPTVLKGNCVVNIPCRISGGSHTIYNTITAALKKTSGGVTSTITTADAAWNLGSLPETAYKMLSIFLDVPATTLKFGDTLTLYINIYSGETGTSSDNTFYLGHNPTGGLDGTWTSTSVSTKLSAQVPFKINI